MKCHKCNAITEKEGRCHNCGAFVYELPLIGKLALRYKTVTKDQLNESIQIKKKLKKEVPLERIWVQKNYASSEQVELLFTIKEFMALLEIDKTFIKIALKKGFVDASQIKAAKNKQYNHFKSIKKIRIIGEILVEDQAMSLENCNKILKAQKRDPVINKSDGSKEREKLNSFEENFYTVRNQDEQFARIAVKAAAVSKNDALVALKKQTKEFRQNSRIMLIGEILFKNEVLKLNQIEKILMEQGRFEAMNGLREKYLNKVTKNEDLEEEIARIDVSDDNMKAFLKCPGGKKPEVSEIKKLLLEKRIRYGVVKISDINSFLTDEKENEFLIAEGKRGFAGKPAKIEYIFDTDLLEKLRDQNRTKDEVEKARKSLQVKKGTVLARKEPMESITYGMNIFGETVSPEDVRLNCGDGAKISKSGLEVVASRTGEPRLSIEKKVFVLSKTNLLEDADVRTGPFECSNFNVAGIVTDAFAIKGGDLKAEEIRGAKLDMIGDIVVDIGIIGAKIKTQGNIRAKYIQNSQIEAFGDVVTENEIIDSNVLSSGTIRSEKSKIVSSSVSAKKGIFSKGIGTGSSIPCMLNVGVDDHILNEIKEIDSELEEIKNRIEALKENRDALALKDSKLNRDIKESTRILDGLSKMLDSVENQIPRIKNKKDKKENKSLRELNIKKSKITAKLRIQKDRHRILVSDYKETDKLFKNASYEYATYKKNSENMIIELRDKKRYYSSWGETVSGKSAMRIEGEIVSGTTVSGPNTSVTIRDDYQNVNIVELKNPKNPSKWDLRFEKSGKFLKLQ